MEDRDDSEYHGDINLDSVRDFLTSKERRRNRALKERLHRAQEDCRRIVELIIAKYRPRRIYTWGSVVHTDRFSEISDIDLAIEGIGRAEVYFAMLGDASKITSFPVDIIELEKVDPVIAERIRTRGKLVYDEDCNR